jgi:hypothetical protein
MIDRRHYSLEVLQHPLRARMCGFGDKVCLMLLMGCFCHNRSKSFRTGDR